MGIRAEPNRMPSWTNGRQRAKEPEPSYSTEPSTHVVMRAPAVPSSASQPVSSESVFHADTDALKPGSPAARSAHHQRKNFSFQ